LSRLTIPAISILESSRLKDWRPRFNRIHHGAVHGITGSCHELNIDNQAGLLVDCGLFQGAELPDGRESIDRLEIDFLIDHIVALAVTHIHIDHTGRIPYLLAAGYTGPITCSEVTACLLPMVLEDAIRMGITRK
jgi:metallo-beta-lactamase family protein